MKKNKKINKIDLFWKANPNKVKEKSIDWYWIFWILNLFLIFVIYKYWDNPYLSIILFLLGILTTFAPKEEYKMVTYKIVDDGFLIDDGKKEIHFEEIDSFNIDYDKDYIFLKLKNPYTRLVEIPFESDHQMHTIEEFLKTKIQKNNRLNIPPLENFFRELFGL